MDNGSQTCKSLLVFYLILAASLAMALQSNGILLDSHGCLAMALQSNAEPNQMQFNFKNDFGFSTFSLSGGNRLDQQLKNLESGQPRWSPDSSLYIAYLRDLQDKRREDLLLSMHVKCSERWFLLQLMKKYAGIALICSGVNICRQEAQLKL